MKDLKHNKIKMSTRFTGKKKNKDEAYSEFFKGEVDLVVRGLKKPEILPSLIHRKR